MVSTDAIIFYTIVIVFSYFLGSISTSIIVSKIIQGMDIRQMGSGNAGTTNVLRNLGKRAAFWVLGGDILKTVAAVFLGRMLLGEVGAWIGGFFCIIGHIFPVFFQFKGGKGVLSTATMLACVDLRLFVISIVVFVLTMLIKKTVSFSSVSSALILIISAFILAMPIYQKVIAIIIFLLVIIKHKENIIRLWNGTEPATTFKKKV